MQTDDDDWHRAMFDHSSVNDVFLESMISNKELFIVRGRREGGRTASRYLIGSEIQKAKKTSIRFWREDSSSSLLLAGLRVVRWNHPSNSLERIASWLICLREPRDCCRRFSSSIVWRCSSVVRAWCVPVRKTTSIEIWRSIRSLRDIHDEWEDRCRRCRRLERSIEVSIRVNLSTMSSMLREETRGNRPYSIDPNRRHERHVEQTDRHHCEDRDFCTSTRTVSESSDHLDNQREISRA